MMFSKSREIMINETFKAHLALFGDETQEILSKLIKCRDEETLMLKFLYSTMPISDMANYPFETFLDYAKHGIYLWKESPFSVGIPEDIFLNYVVHHRINEEEIEPCRSFFYDKLKERIKDKTIKDTVIEVNYWCSEEVTYQSTDERTASPITVYKGAYGRCGEESTFTVSVLRSVGIPARQVYAPRWSHCDDNHAWVEVWIEGKWFFLGACEPEEILNKGWFTNASSRAMLVHSRWFDVKHSNEEFIQKTGRVTLLNNLSLYAPTKLITIKVLDEYGALVQGALVDFEVINYSEFYPIASLPTDEVGEAKFTTGFGIIHIHVSKEGIYTERMMDVKEEQEMTIMLRSEEIRDTWINKEMIAPVDTPINLLNITLEQKQQGKEKIKVASGKRSLKVAAFFEGKSADEYEQVELARGNFEEIKKFLVHEKTEHLKNWKEKMLTKLSKKDFRDCKCNILIEHLEYGMKYVDRYEEDIFVECILNPRIHLEPLTKYREFIDTFYTEEQKCAMQRNPKLIWEQIESRVMTRDELEYPNITTSPVGCLKVRRGSKLSKKILFVAICRTLGVAARLNPIDEGIEYSADGVFIPVINTYKKNATLTINSGYKETSWIYFQDWSIAKLIDGRYTTLHLADKQWIDKEMTLTLETGRYRITTSNRLPNGNIFAQVYILELKDDEKKTVQLSIKEAKLSEMLEEVVLPEFELLTENKDKVAMQDLLTEEKMLLIWLEGGKEPTEHILNEIFEKKEHFKVLEQQIIFVIQNKEVLKDPTFSKLLQILGGVRIYYDDFEDNINILARRMYVDPDKLPFIMITQKQLHGIYATSGYNVGTGDMLLRILNKV